MSYSCEYVPYKTSRGFGIFQATISAYTAQSVICIRAVESKQTQTTFFASGMQCMKKYPEATIIFIVVSRHFVHKKRHNKTNTH